MSLTTRKLHPQVGAEIVGVDVSRVDEATFQELVAAFNEHSVLLFRGQSLEHPEQQDGLVILRQPGQAG